MAKLFPEVASDFGRYSTPKADLVETDTTFWCSMELAGCAPEDVTVTQEGTSRIDVCAERKHCCESKETDIVHMKERYFGKMQRTIFFPDNANVDAAKTTFKNGVLCLSVPKKSPSKRLLPLETA